MAFGLIYAHGPCRISEGVPSSAFSKGAILMFTSASSLSGLPVSTNSLGALPDGSVIGVAMADSTASLDNKVPYVIADRDTVFWSDCTIGSQYTAGESVDVEWHFPYWYATTSAITPLLRVVPRGDSVSMNGIGGSNSQQSRILVKFDETCLQFRA